MKTDKWLAVLMAVVIITTAFIFSNSLKQSVESNESSDRILDKIEPIVDRLDSDNTWNLNYIIRKGAHLTEFALLGIFSAALLIRAKGKRAEQLVAYPLLYTLIVAVTDEYIQSLGDRTSSVEDIMIDFIGAVIGICVAYLVKFAKNRKQYKKAL